MKPEFWRENTARFYDRAWDFSGGAVKGPIRYFPIVNFLKAFFALNAWRDSERSLLEIGCAAGRFYEALRKTMPCSFRYEGLDISPHHLARALERYPDIKFHQRDALDSGLASRGFDVVIAVDVVIHNWDVPALLAEWSRLTRHCLILAARTMNGAPSVRANQGREGVPYHIINLDVLQAWIDDLGPEFVLVLPYPAPSIEIGPDVYNLPDDFDPLKFGHHTFFIFKDLSDDAARFVRKVSELVGKDPAVLWGSVAPAPAVTPPRRSG
ncbi:MAG: class I SAM-dependent methyltransferase [Pseudomonadota bacterium]